MRRHGLSLVEILVSIGIILILMGMAFPSYFKAIGKAMQMRNTLDDRYK